MRIIVWRYNSICSYTGKGFGKFISFMILRFRRNYSNNLPLLALGKLFVSNSILRIQGHSPNIPFQLRYNQFACTFARFYTSAPRFPYFRSQFRRIMFLPDVYQHIPKSSYLTINIHKKLLLKKGRKKIRFMIQLNSTQFLSEFLY